MPSWVSEGSERKYHRAVEKLRVEKKEATEEAIKALYVQFGGLVVEGPQEITEEPEAPKRKKKSE